MMDSKAKGIIYFYSKGGIMDNFIKDNEVNNAELVL